MLYKIIKSDSGSSQEYIIELEEHQIELFEKELVEDFFKHTEYIKEEDKEYISTEDTTHNLSIVEAGVMDNYLPKYNFSLFKQDYGI